MRGAEEGRDEQRLGSGDRFNSSPGIWRRVLNLVAMVLETFVMF